MAPIAVRKCRRVLDNVRRVIGMELLCAAQGLDFLEPLRPGLGVRTAHDAIRREIPHLVRDRFLRRDLERMTSPGSPVLGAILVAVEKSLGPLS